VPYNNAEEMEKIKKKITKNTQKTQKTGVIKGVRLHPQVVLFYNSRIKSVVRNVNTPRGGAPSEIEGNHLTG